MFHPNVDAPSGAICLDILKDRWSAALSVATILLSLQVRAEGSVRACVRLSGLPAATGSH